ncbi:hypothetical protein B484DRAFT_398813 [Ochromonadaceae sp. CCMP2298]|nr:hypothetical protein B484DRAFT_398813 [Ochromonadaceae sp. CCMP2298]
MSIAELEVKRDDLSTRILICLMKRGSNTTKLLVTDILKRVDIQRWQALEDTLQNREVERRLNRLMGRIFENDKISQLIHGRGAEYMRNWVPAQRNDLNAAVLALLSNEGTQATRNLLVSLLWSDNLRRTQAFEDTLHEYREPGTIQKVLQNFRDNLVKVKGDLRRVVAGAAQA